MKIVENNLEKVNSIAIDSNKLVLNLNMLYLSFSHFNDVIRSEYKISPTQLPKQFQIKCRITLKFT